MASKEFYQIRSRTLDGIVNDLNFILSRISERLDQMEGNRGTSTVQDGLTIESSDEIVHGFNTENEV
jgi:hypothetical protein